MPAMEILKCNHVVYELKGGYRWDGTPIYKLECIRCDFASDWKMIPEEAKYNWDDKKIPISEQKYHKRDCGCLVNDFGEMIRICEYHKKL